MDKKGREEDVRARRVKRNILTYMIVIPLIPLFLAVGISIGACGSIISMRRFLDT